MNNAKKLTSLALAISLSLGGGLALAVDHAGHSEDESSSATQAVSDTWITTKVKAELATADGVKSTDISVTTVDGVVTLTGMLASKTGVEKAIAVAKGIKGVKRVEASGLKSG